MNFFDLFFIVTLFLSGFGFGACSITIFVDKLERGYGTPESKSILRWAVMLFVLCIVCLYLSLQ